MEEEISLVDLFNILKKHIKMIIISVLITVIIAAIYTFILVTPKYESGTELIVSQSVGETENVSQQDITTSIQLINTYSNIIRNDVILDPVIEELNLDMTADELREIVTVENEGDSQVFSIKVQNENPYEASTIANTIAETFQGEIQEIMNVDNVTVISVAHPDTQPISPNNLLNLIIGVLLGGMIGVGIALAVELTDTTVKSEDYLTNELGWTVLGQVNKLTKDDLTIKTALPTNSPPRKQNNMNKETEVTRRRRRV